jgi:hypothetical protein
MRSLVGITETDGEQTLYLLKDKAPPQTVAVTGVASNYDPNMTNFGVGATSWGTSFEMGASMSYTVNVEAGKPFSLYGFHLKFGSTGQEVDCVCYGWAKADHAGSTQPVTLNLDLAQALTPEKVTGTMTLPTGGLVATASLPRWWVRQKEKSVILGIATKTTKKPNGEFDYEGEYIKPTDTTGVLTTYLAQVGMTDWFGSYIEVEGFPQAGAKVGPFLDVPELTKPASVTAPLRRNGTIEWKNPEPTAVPLIMIQKGKWKPYAWIVEGKPGMTTITLPDLPTTASATDVLGTDASVPAKVVLCGDRDVAKQWCPKHADGKEFLIETATP